MKDSEAIKYITDFLEMEQNKHSRLTGFGFGFYRWVSSYDLHVKTKLPYYQLRNIYSKLVDNGKILKKQNRSRGMIEYSALGWHNCISVGDYFIETLEN